MDICGHHLFMIKNQRGQTSIEYILMIAAVVAIMASVFGVLRERFIGDGDCNGNPDTLMCRLNATWDASNPGVFKFYPL